MTTLQHMRVIYTEPGNFTTEPMQLDEKAIIRYGRYTVPWGSCFLAHIDETICFLGFCTTQEDEQRCYNDLSLIYDGFVIVQDHEHGAALCKKIFDNSHHHTFSILFSGTPFQHMVWSALLNVPTGTTMTYSAFANLLRRPQAVRAVASAIGRNNISYLVPCHRIVSSTGKVHKYRWGADYKKRLLIIEQTQ